MPEGMDDFDPGGFCRGEREGPNSEAACGPWCMTHCQKVLNLVKWPEVKQHGKTTTANCTAIARRGPFSAKQLDVSTMLHKQCPMGQGEATARAVAMGNNLSLWTSRSGAFIAVHPFPFKGASPNLSISRLRNAELEADAGLRHVHRRCREELPELDVPRS